MLDPLEAALQRGILTTRLPRHTVPELEEFAYNTMRQQASMIIGKVQTIIETRRMIREAQGFVKQPGFQMITAKMDSSMIAFVNVVDPPSEFASPAELDIFDSYIVMAQKAGRDDTMQGLLNRFPVGVPLLATATDTLRIFRQQGVTLAALRHRTEALENLPDQGAARAMQEIDGWYFVLDDDVKKMLSSQNEDDVIAFKDILQEKFQCQWYAVVSMWASNFSFSGHRRY
jgi:hypothetical protein